MTTRLPQADILRIREDIIQMQKWISLNAPRSTDPKIVRLVDDLSNTRSSVESLIV